MKKFNVDVSRRFWQLEVGQFVVFAANAKEARRKAKEMMAEAQADWQPNDSGYEDYEIEDVVEDTP